MKSDSPFPETLEVEGPICPSSKGKEPMGIEELDSHRANCGICLTEEGQSVRGCIDSCDHYFCFLCIIEWSKIESRCPLCKQRFSSIRRMRTDGTLIGHRAVSVPLRDQIYDPQRTMTSRPPDPYANISCNICTGSSDENLMLLCDLCDTAAHTYCAGLDATIPEGDWFCQECAQMKAEELNSEPSTNLGSSPTPDHNTEKVSVQPSSSIFDIVRGPREPGDPEVDRLMTMFSPQQQHSLSSANPLLRQAHRNIAGPSGRGSTARMKSGIKVTESSVRTLDRCRDVNKYIRDLRENWNALRSGSLNFSSSRFDSGASNNSKVNTSSRGHHSDGSSCVDTPNKDLYNVDRAWKMFNIAKSKQPQKLSGTSPLASKNLSLKGSPFKGSRKLSPGEACKAVPSKTTSNTYTGFKMQQVLEKYDGCGSKGLGQRVNGIVFERQNTTTNRTGLSAAASLGKSTAFPKNKNMHQSIKNDVFYGRAVISSQEKLVQGSLHQGREQVLSIPQKLPSGSLAGTSGVPCINLQAKPSSLNFEKCSISTFDCDDRKHTGATESNQLQESAVKRNTEYINNGSKRIKVNIEAKHTRATESNQLRESAVKRRNTEYIDNGSKRIKVDIEAKHTRATESNQLQESAVKRRNTEYIDNGKVDIEAKSEIQSLVKLNLKLLSAGKRLEVDEFKHIARHSTHEILAACGLEPRRYDRLSIQKPNCFHEEQNKHQSKLSLMPSSCRACFHAFVKDVVSSVLSERIDRIPC